MTTKRLGFLLAEKWDNWDTYIDAFEKEIARLKTDVIITYAPPRPDGADGDAASIEEAADYLAKNTDIIVTAGTRAALALKRATATTKTPFVFASVGDPGLSGLTPQKGGNFTGGHNQQVALVKDRVDYMLSRPKVFQQKFAVAGNYFNEPAKSAMTLASSLLGGAYLASISPGDDIDAFVANLKGMGIKSLYVCSDLYLTAKSKKLNQACHAGLAAKKIKTMFEFAEHIKKHQGDEFYGLSFQDLFVQAAGYADKIVRRKVAAAGDLPIYTTKVFGKAPAKKK